MHVLVGILRRADGKILIARRPSDKHLGGQWEFPGGKRQRGEDRLTTLKRELAEELGIVVVSAHPLIDFVHAHGDRDVRLDVWWVDEYDEDVCAREGQLLRWVTVGELDAAALIGADRPIVEAIREKLTVNTAPA